MKRNIFKSVLFLSLFVCLAAIFTFSSSAKSIISGDFVFEVNGNKATLTEYKGNAASVKIPSKVEGAYVTAIGNEAFWSKKEMTSISIPSSVTSIGTAAFNECTGLKKVVLPSKFKKISNSAFWYCTNLKKIVIPESVKSIGKNAFRGCDKLTAYVVKGSYGETHIKTLTNVKLAYRYVSAIKLSKSSLDLTVGETAKLTYKLSPTLLYNDSVEWKSSNKKIAKVSSKGKVVAVSPGKATITLTAKDGSGKKAKCTVTVIPEKVTSVKQKSVTATSYTLYWSKVQNATGYRIYRYNSKTKKWDILKNTTKTSLKITGINLGSSDKYIVRAYAKVDGKNYFSEKSKTYTFRTLYPAKVTGIKATVSDKAIKLTWSKAKNATGYRIYGYDTAKKKYTLLAKTEKTSYKISSLKSNTTYVYMIRSIMTHKKETIKSEYSAHAKFTTKPSVVKNFGIADNSVYTDNLTLKWSKLKGVTGYRIYQYDNSKKAYASLVTLKDVNTTSYTVKNLKPGTEYSFKIKAYSNLSGENLFGSSSDALKAKTNNGPATNKEAFQLFLDAYNKAKASKDSFTLVTNTNVTNISAESKENYPDILSAVAKNSSSMRSFVSGIDKSNKTSVSTVLSPKNKLSALKYTDLNSKTVSFSEDGNGYRITFTLKQESTPTANAQIAEVVDWNKISQNNEAFTLESCIYKGTTVSAKVHGAKLDDITVTVPIEVKFTLDGEKNSFSEAITTKHIFLW